MLHAMPFADNFEVNTPDSHNKLVEQFAFKLMRSFNAAKSSGLLTESEIKTYDFDLKHLNELGEKIANKLYIIKGLVNTTPEEQQKALQKYTMYLEEAQQVAPDTYNLYMQTITRIVQKLHDEQKPGESQEIHNKIRVFYNAADSLKSIKNLIARIEPITNIEPFKDNPNSLQKIIEEQFGQKDSNFRSLFEEIKKRWNVVGVAASQMLGINPTVTETCLQHGRQLPSIKAQQINQKHFGNDLFEPLMVVASGNNSLGTIDELLDHYANLIDISPKENKQRIIKELFNKTFERNGIPKEQVIQATFGNKGPDSLYMDEAMREGTAKKIAYAMPLFNESQKERFFQLLTGTTKVYTPSELLHTPGITREEFYTKLIQSRPNSAALAKELGVSKDYIKFFSKGAAVRKAERAEDIGTRLGFEGSDLKKFIRFSMDSSIPYEKQLEFFEKGFETGDISLRSITAALGIRREDVFARIQIGSGVLSRIEQADSMPAELIDKALKAYKIPAKFEQNFREKFTIQKKTFVEHISGDVQNRSTQDFNR